MLHRCWFRSWVLAASSMLLAACSTTHRNIQTASKGDISNPPKIESAVDEEAEKRAEAYAHFATGYIHDMNEEPDAALQDYYQAALNDPENETLVLDVSKDALLRKQPEKALELLSRAAARPNASGTVYARLGMVYAQQGKTEQAVAASRQAIKRSPGLLEGYQNLFLTYLQNKQEAEAVKVLDEAARQPGTDADFLVNLGELYGSYVQQAPTQKEKIKPRATAVLERAERLDPANPSLRLHLADSYNLFGDSDKAARLYLDLLKRLPDVPFVRERLHSKLAGIYLRASERKAAAEQLRALVHDDPTNPMPYYYLGFLAYEEKKFAEATDYFSKTVLLGTDFEDAYYELGLSQLSQNQVSDALATFDKARRRFKQNFVLEFYTGLAYNRQKGYAEALRHFTAAEVIAKATDPRHLDQDLYFQLGACSERLGDLAQAERYFEKCLQLAPDFAEAQNYLGYMWAEHGLKLERAKELIEKAVKTEPKNAAYLDSLAWVLFKLKQPEAALEQARKAVELSSEPDATVYDHLGDIYAALKQPEKAREAWTKALSLEPSDQVRQKLESGR